MNKPLTVTAVNLSQRMALMSDDTFAVITDMFDEMGDFTDEPTEARSCVVKYSEDSWFAVLLAGEFVRVTVQ